jgi:hypothetical protein
MNLYRYFQNSGDTFDAIEKQNLLPDPIATGPTGAEVLARNVTKFIMKGYSIGVNGTISDYHYSTDTPLPDFFDIELTAIDNETVKRFKTDDQSEWVDTNSFVYKQNARTFRTRVHLSTGAVTRLSTPTPSPSPTPAP